MTEKMKDVLLESAAEIQRTKKANKQTVGNTMTFWIYVTQSVT